MAGYPFFEQRHALTRRNEAHRLSRRMRFVRRRARVERAMAMVQRAGRWALRPVHEQADS